MRLYIWSENIDNGAYHGDASAVVLAESVSDALALLQKHDEGEEYQFYKAGNALVKDVREIEIPTEPTVVLITTGCDC